MGSNQIGYERINHLVIRQHEQEERLLQELRKGTYTVQQPLVVVNPYFVNPLTAMILFSTEEKQQVTVTVKGIEPAGDITHTFPAATEHVLPILGLYPEYENQVEVTLAQGERATVTIQTERIENMPYHAD